MNSANKGPVFFKGLCILIIFLIVLGPFGSSGSAMAEVKNLPVQAGAQASEPNYVPGEIIVKFKKGKVNKALHKLAGTSLVKNLRDKDSQLVKLSRGSSIGTLLTFYRLNPDVEYAEPNYIVKAAGFPNDTRAGEQWALEKLQLPQAWELTTGKPTVKIAILDTGVDLDHPDLTPNLVSGADFIDPDTTPEDENGHGTHVAGIAAAAINNNLGVAGAAGGVQVMPVRVLDQDGNGYTDSICDGIRWAADHGARVINMSLGSANFSFSEQAAINYAYSKGAVIVAAAGNFKTDVFYPAAYNHVIAVSATDEDDDFAAFSNFGPKVDVAAPGVNILSTTPNHPVTEHLTPNYGYFSGTSMASPHVAGLAALILCQNPLLTPDEVEARIKATADDLGAAGFDNYFGYGRINALKALTVTDTHEPNDTFETAFAAKMGEPQVGIIDKAGDGDWFKYDINTNRIRVNLSLPAGLNGSIEIYNSAGQPVQNIDQGGTGTAENLLVQLPAQGVYYFKVSGAADTYSGSPYNLQVSYSEVYEGNDSFSEAKAIPLQGTITAKINPFGDQDYYQIAVPQQSTARITLQPPAEMNGILYLYDNNKNLILHADNRENGGAEVITRKLAPGNYYLRVMDMNNGYYNEDYTLKTEMTAPEVLSNSPAANEKGVAVDRSIKITFKGNILPGPAFENILLKKGNTVITDFKKSISGSELTIKTNTDLSCGTSYQVILPAGSISDSSGNYLLQAYNFLFETALTPTLVINGPVGDTATNLSQFRITGTTLADRRVLINGSAPDSLTDNKFSKLVNLTPGLNTITVTSADNLGNLSAQTRKITLDKTPPYIVSAYTPLVSATDSATTTFRVGWSAKDPAPAAGIDSYDIQVKKGLAGPWENWKVAWKQSYALYPGITGKTYYFRIRARDKAGNLSAWSTMPLKTAVPFDDSSLIAGRKGFAAISKISGSYLGTLRVSGRNGEELTYRFSGSKVYLLTYKGPGCSKAKIYLDGVYKGTIDTWASASSYRRVIYTAGWTRAGTHSLRIVNLGTGGRPWIKLDGLAVEN